MTYNQFLDQFLSDLLSVFSWVKRNLFPISPVGRSFYSEHLIFTIIGLGLIVTVIEELAGILSSFRFGGLLFRHFRVLYPRSYQVLESPDYSKEKVARPYRSLFRPFYRQKYDSQYFIKYDGRYFPVQVPRYNPFAISRFNADYRAGKIVSFDTQYNPNFKGSMFKNVGRAFGFGYFKKLVSGKYDGFLHLGNSDYDLASLDDNYSGDSGISFADELPKSNKDLNFESLSDNESYDSKLDIYYDEDD